MKKDIEWLKNEVNKLPLRFLGFSMVKQREEFTVNKDEVIGLIDQLDEQEVLSPDWIDKHSNGPSRSQYVWVDDLKELLVPKQEKVKVPQFVADWIVSSKHNSEDNLRDSLMNVPSKVNSWLWEDNAESNFDLFARAWLDGFTVEEEQKYYVVGKDNTAILSKGIDGNPYPREGVFSDYFVGHEDYMLTEQEIKDYDERYFAFAVKVEEMEE